MKSFVRYLDLERSTRSVSLLLLCETCTTSVIKSRIEFNVNSIFNEVRKVLEEMVGEPCPEEDWKDFIGKVDYDNSGTISFPEFLYALFLWFADEDVSFKSCSVILTCVVKDAEQDEDDEKDEVDMAFAILKNKFRDQDTDKDEAITKTQFTKILESLDPSLKVTEQLVDTIYSQLEVADKKSNKITFKQYLYGMYIYVTKPK
jgi:Ca2+-binding EF-hand superfamily protein